MKEAGNWKGFLISRIYRQMNTIVSLSNFSFIKVMPTIGSVKIIVFFLSLFRKTNCSHVSKEPASLVLESNSNGPIPTTASKFYSPRQRNGRLPGKPGRNNPLQQLLSSFHWSAWCLRTKCAKWRSRATNSRLIRPAPCRSGEKFRPRTYAAGIRAVMPCSRASLSSRDRCTL